jgi:hypothetical protein
MTIVIIVTGKYLVLAMCLAIYWKMHTYYLTENSLQPYTIHITFLIFYIGSLKLSNLLKIKQGVSKFTQKSVSPYFEAHVKIDNPIPL